MARRYSGDLNINIVWDDARSRYIGKINVAGARNLRPALIQASPPATWKAVDSPESFDAAARAALAFAADLNWPVDDYAEFNDKGEYVIRRTPWIRQLK